MSLRDWRDWRRNFRKSASLGNDCCFCSSNDAATSASVTVTPCARASPSIQAKLTSSCRT